jgi:hypothetical protein
MKINHRLAAAGVAGALAVTGLAAVVVAPLASAASDTATADATDDGTATRAAGRVQAITDALAGLVGDGTLTQAQADEVATTLAESDALRGGGHGGGRGIDLGAAAEALGLTTDELRTALAADGATLASVAEAQGVELSVLTDALVAAGTERVQASLADGRITQEEADAAIAALPGKVAERVEQELPARGGGRAPQEGADEVPAPTGTVTPSSTDGV